MGKDSSRPRVLPVRRFDEREAIAAVLAQPDFKDVVRAVRAHTRGPIYLAGSRVYGTIAQHLYGRGEPNDWDFVIDEIKELSFSRLTAFLGLRSLQDQSWTLVIDGYEHDRYLERGACHIDLMPFSDLPLKGRRIVQKNNLDDYLAHVPFDVQSIVFDIQKNKLVGEAGMRALRDRHVSVHCLDNAAIAARHRATTVRAMMEEKSTRLCFTYSLPLEVDASNLHHSLTNSRCGGCHEELSHAPTEKLFELVREDGMYIHAACRELYAGDVLRELPVTFSELSEHVGLVCQEYPKLTPKEFYLRLRSPPRKE